MTARKQIPGAPTLVFLLSYFVLVGGAIGISQCEADLLHYWDFDETSGTTAADSVGGLNLTLNNFADTTSHWVTGQFGGGLHFDGSDDFGTNTAGPGPNEPGGGGKRRSAGSDRLNTKMPAVEGQCFLHVLVPVIPGVGSGELLVLMLDLLIHQPGMIAAVALDQEVLRTTVDAEIRERASSFGLSGQMLQVVV